MATINATNHTVSIEVTWDAIYNDLSPTITLSYGATVIPASGVSKGLHQPRALYGDGGGRVTYQEWTVTVTQEAEPVVPIPTGGAIIKFWG